MTKRAKMKRIIIYGFIAFNLLSCSNMTDIKNELSQTDPKCTFEQVNSEINEFSESAKFLDTVFHLNKKEIDFFTSRSNKLKKELKEDIMFKFMARLNDISKIDSKCAPPGLPNITLSDISLFCLAKIEPMPFALATGCQNCTEPWISKEISLPVNFTHYYIEERERITYRYLKYFYSKERNEFLNRNGYD